MGAIAGGWLGGRNVAGGLGSAGSVCGRVSGVVATGGGGGEVGGFMGGGGAGLLGGVVGRSQAGEFN